MADGHAGTRVLTPAECTTCRARAALSYSGRVSSDAQLRPAQLYRDTKQQRFWDTEILP